MDVYGVNRTKVEAMSPSNLLDPQEAGGVVRWFYDSYEAAALASGQVIGMCCDLPLNYRMVDWVIDHDALGSAVTLKFGTVEDDDEFMTATACSAADKKNMTDDGVAQAVGFKGDTEVAAAEKTKLIITVGGAAATGTILLSFLASIKT